MRPILLATVCTLIFATTGYNQKEKCGDAIYSFQGTLASSSSTTPVVKDAYGTTPKIGDVGELAKHFEESLFGGLISGWLVIGTVEVTGISNGQVSLKVIEKQTNVVINGKSKNLFVAGKFVKFSMYEFDSPGIKTIKNSQDKVIARGVMVCGKKIGEWEYFDNNGNLSEIYTLKDDKMDGDYKAYYPNGKLKEEGFYDRGEKEKSWKLYYETGTLQEEGEYGWTGKKDKTWTTYYKNGNKASETNYQYGDQRGKYLEWFENGSKKTEGEYSYNGKKDKTWNTYYTNGNKESEIYYYGGEMKGAYTTWFENGQTKETGKYDYWNSKKDGAWNSFYADGKKESTATYEDDKLKGSYKKWFANGNLSVEENYDNWGKGQKVGLAVYYYENGNKKEEINYYNDIVDGEYKMYHENGILKTIGKYNRTSQKIDTWLTYYPSGSKESEIYYQSGMKMNEATTWYENGKTKIASNFVNDKYDGDYIEYNEKGKVMHKGKYSAGNKTGKWQEIDEKGKKKMVKY